VSAQGPSGGLLAVVRPQGLEGLLIFVGPVRIEHAVAPRAHGPKGLGTQSHQAGGLGTYHRGYLEAGGVRLLFFFRLSALEKGGGSEAVFFGSWDFSGRGEFLHISLKFELVETNINIASKS
jgi:hypothetical protein